MIEEVKVLAGLYKVNTELVNRALAGLSADEASLRPDDRGNSMHWITGHIAVTRYGVCRYLGHELEHPFGKQFSRGAQVLEASEYPPVEELLEHWNLISGHLEKSFERIPEEELLAPIKDSFPGVEKTVRGAVAFLHLHESYHVGQLAYIRRLLGHGQLVG